MYQIKQKIRTVFRGVAILASFLAVIATGLVLAAPYLIDNQKVHESLVRSLKAWSGGNVNIDGPIRVSSLIALTIEAKKVSIKDAEHINPVGSITASSVRTVVDFSALLQGKLEFRKVIVTSPKIILKRTCETAFNLEQSGAEPVLLPIVLAGKSPFDELVLKWPTVIYAAKPKAAFRRIKLSQIRMGRTASGMISVKGQFRDKDSQTQLSLRYGTRGTRHSVLIGKLKGHGLEISFNGEANLSANMISGWVSLSQTPAKSHASHGKGLMGLADFYSDMAVTGTLSWSPGRIALDDGEFRYGVQSGRGSIALGLFQARRVLEGTVAYEAFDVGPLLTAVSEKMSGTSFGDKVLEQPLEADLLKRLEVDLRLSAERVVADNISTGPVAVSVTSQNGVINADIAELEVFGGSVNGRLAWSPLGQENALLKLVGKGLEANDLSETFSLPFSASGKTNVSLNLTQQGASPLLERRGIKGQFLMSFPFGLTLKGEALKRIGSNLSDHEWAASLVRGHISVSQLSLDGKVRDGTLATQIEASAEKKRVTGSVLVNLQDHAMNGNVEIQDRSPLLTVQPPEKKPDERLSTLLISGTLAKAEVNLINPVPLQN